MSRKTNPQIKCLGFEELEPRMMLNASPDVAPKVEMIEWQGHDVLVAPGDWIVQIDDPSSSVDLGSHDIQEIVDNAWQIAKDKSNLGNAGFEGINELDNAQMVIQWLGDNGLYSLRAPENLSGEQLVSIFELIPGFVFIEPAMLINTDFIPNDTRFDEQWGLHNVGLDVGKFGGTPATSDADIDAPEAWEVTMGSGDIVVGVIDKGIDYTHPDLYLNMWLNQGEIPSEFQLVDTDFDGQITFYDLNNSANSSFVSDLNNTGYIDAGDLFSDPTWANGDDDEENGYTDDFCGYSFLGYNPATQSGGSNDPMDFKSHGTHVAGIIGAVGNNAEGVIGVCPNVKLMALKTDDASGSLSTQAIVLAMEYVETMREQQYDVNIRVTNNSYSHDAPWESLRLQIEDHEELGILFVCSAGNTCQDIGDESRYPAAYDESNIITVAATSQNDELGWFSCWGGEEVDIAAPGVNILSTCTGDYPQYYYMNGTSMAAPCVAGAAALLWDVDPNATYQTIKEYLLSTTDRLDALSISEAQLVTNGRLNLARAIEAADGVNDAPIAEDMTMTCLPGAILEGQVSAIDAESDAITYSLVDDVDSEHGQLIFDSDGTFEFEPFNGWHGVEQFTFTASDGDLESNIAVVTLIINELGLDWQQYYERPWYNEYYHERFGESISVHGDYMIVGIPDGRLVPEQPGVFPAAGRAMVFRQVDEKGWFPVTSNDLWSLSMDNGSKFGQSVAIEGDTIVVGAPCADWNNISNSGYCHVYTDCSAEGDWTETNLFYLHANDYDSGDQAGYSVDISEGLIVVGAPGDNANGEDAGAAYVFEDTTGSGDWSQIAKLTAEDGEAGDEFGWSVCISANTIIVGAPLNNSGQGASYIFKDIGSGWQQTRKLTASDGEAPDQFGYAVSIDEEIAIVGAPYHGFLSGSAYVFENSGGFWNQTGILNASDGQMRDYFGTAVAVADSRILVGADGAESAYVFENLGTGWNDAHEAKIMAEDTTAGSEFGYSVNIDENHIFVGAPGFSEQPGLTERGAAYVFEQNRAPAVDDFSAVSHGTGDLEGELLGFDFEDDALSYSIVDQPDQGYGSVTVDGDDFTYTPGGADQPYVCDFTYKANDGDADSNVGTVTLYVGPPQVMDRMVFHNDSWVDGDAGASTADDDAIDARIVPWVVTETYDPENNVYVSGYDKGLNGVMIDVFNLADPEGLSVGDFTFEQGSGGTWAAAEAPSIVDVRDPDPATGYSRITLIWDEADAVKDDWLRVTVEANAQTGLAADDVFCFASLRGDATGDGFVGGDDMDIIRANWGNLEKWVHEGNIDMTGIVGGDDLDIVRSNWAACLDDPMDGGRDGGGGDGELYFSFSKETDEIFRRYGIGDNDPTNDIMPGDRLWTQFVDELFASIEATLASQIGAAA